MDIGNSDVAGAELAARARNLIEQLTKTVEELQHAARSEPQRNARSVEPALFTVEEAAEALALSRSAVFKLIKTGELQSVRIGSRRRVPASAVDEFTRRLVAGSV